MTANSTAQPVSLREIGYFYGGLTGKSGKDFGRGNSKYITFMNVINNVIAKSDLTDYVEIKDGERQNKVSKGDLLFNGSSETPEEVAFPSLVTRDLEGLYLNSFCFGFRFEKSDIVDPLFFAYYLRSNYGRQFMSQLAQGSTRYNISKRALLDIEWNIPKIKEQIAIAEVLSDIDELITFLKRELIKKINLRTAFTQRRLKFENAKKVKLRNYANFSKGSGLPKSQLTTNGKFKAIHYGELFLKYPESIRRVISRTDTSSNAIYSRVNDVLMPSSDVTPTGLAVASCIREDDVILGGDVLIIRPNSASELDGRYLSYVIRNSKQEILKLVRGTTVYHIYGKDMADFELFLPGIDEQIEIVESLDLQREEISLLEEELQKYEWLKQGMMNDLLTGKVRLV